MTFRKIVQPIYTAYVVVSFLVCLILLFPIFVLLSLFNNHTSRLCTYHVIRAWARVWLSTIGMPMNISGSVANGVRHIVVANHISYMDTVVIFPSLPGYFRVLGKAEIASIPLIGLIYRQVAVMVSRGSPESRAKSMRSMLQVLKEEGNIMIFPEGTFNETGNTLKPFYNGAFRLAISTQTDILPIVFPDTVHRWHYSAWWKLWPGQNRAIYLPPISVKGMTPNDVTVLKQQVMAAMATELEKYVYP